MRGQGYDGASNMCGAWNGLQALFIKDCPSAYYVHCFAHHLQLSLVAAAKDVHDVWLFHSKLNSIVNLVCGSAKRRSELKSAREIEIANLLAHGELETGKGANQVCTLQRPGATRWSSHFAAVNRLIDLFGVTCIIIERMMSNGPNSSIRGEAKGIFKAMRSFEFVFNLFLMNQVMGITDILCRALQSESQDILNAIRSVSSTKELLQKLRINGWNDFLLSVKSFCEKHDIDAPDMIARYMDGTRRSCQQKDFISIGHYYYVDIFNVVIDFQLMKIDSRFPDQAMELLSLSSSLDPTNAFQSFNIDHICTLVERFYHQDFTQKEIDDLRRQLQHYALDVVRQSGFKNLSSLSELCQQLAESRKSQIYFLIDRLIRLILTLHVSTATTERAFSAMKPVKTSLRNKMEEEF